MWWLLRSPWGRAFAALRDNPIRAESLGVNITAYTLLAFAIFLLAYGGLRSETLIAFQKKHTSAVKTALGILFLVLAMVILLGQRLFQ